MRNQFQLNKNIKMKTLFLILGVILIAFIVLQLFAIKGQRNIETYPYIVKKKI